MLHLSENLKKYRILKNLTQEDVAEYLGITPQSVSKWERGVSYPDITILPALANMFETSIDLENITAKFSNGIIIVTIPKLIIPKHKVNVE